MIPVHAHQHPPLADPALEQIERWIEAEADLHGVPARLATLARYWMALGGDGRIPDRRAVDPSLLKPVLPYILIFGLERRVEVLTAVRIRLMGTALVGIFGRDWTGLTTRDFDRADQVAEHLARMQAIADMGRPLYWRHRSLAEGCEDLFAEHLFCPLTNGAGEVSCVITALDFPGMECDPRVRDLFSPLLMRHS